MEKFKSLKEAQEAFEKEGFEYPTYKSGAKKGHIKGTLDSLTKMFIDAMAEKKSTVEETPEAEVAAEEPTDKTSAETKDETESPAEAVEEEVVSEESAEESEESSEESEEAEEATKPKFHRPIPKKFNPMSFKKY